jgi:hypothetical protein
VTSKMAVVKRINDLRTNIFAVFFSKAFFRIVLPPRLKVETGFN